MYSPDPSAYKRMIEACVILTTRFGTALAKTPSLLAMCQVLT